MAEEEKKEIAKMEDDGEYRIEADLHRFSIGTVLHQQYSKMQEEYMRWCTYPTKAEYPAMATLDTMVRAQVRPYPDILAQYDERVKDIDRRYGEINMRRWTMHPGEALERKTLLENLLIDLGPTRIDERPQAPKYKAYDEGYRFDGREIVNSLFEKRLTENRNLNLLFTGKVGGGKSYATLSTADYLSKGQYDLNGFVFDVLTFINRTRTAKPGDVIILDEAGVSAGSKDSMTKGVKSLSKVIQSTRYLQLCTEITLPNFNFLDKQIRLMVDLIFDHEEDQRQGEFTVYVPVLSDDGKDVKMSPLIHKGKIIRSVFFPLPKPSLVREYEEMRRKHNLAQLKDLEEELNPEPKNETNRGKNLNSKRNLMQYRGRENEEE